MLSVCRMYIKDVQFAEDVLLKAFFKVFNNLKNFRNEGSFEGWIRRIVVCEAIDFLRSQKRRGYSVEFTDANTPVSEDSYATKAEIEEVQQYIDQLPDGYKTVLVLYAVEGYKHAEIAKMMGISENTSKSQLFKARKMLKEKFGGLNEKELGR